jgi:hypothetical protein
MPITSNHIIDVPQRLQLHSVSLVWAVSNFGSVDPCISSDFCLIGIVSTWIFVDPPRFHIATSINLAFALAMAAFSGFVVLYLARVNKGKRDMIAQLEREVPSGEWDSLRERKRLGDRHPRFEYTL